MPRDKGPHRVVVTGVGVLSPIGAGRETFWNGLLEGNSGFRPIRSFDASRFRVGVGAEIPDFDPGPWFRRTSANEAGRAASLALAATHLALADAGLDLEIFAPGKVGVALGTTSGEPGEVERHVDAALAERSSGDSLARRYPSHHLATTIAAELDLEGPCLMIPSACAAGNYALAEGFENVRSGRAEVMIAGGADAFSRITFMGFARLGAIAPDICRPFDLERKGMIPGEGAGFLVLESLAGARARGAVVLAEIDGYGLSCDAHHMTAAAPDGEGPARAMTAALAASGRNPEEIDYVSAHGTGTKTNDVLETRALKRALGTAAHHVPISSIKSMIGHTMGAASALEAIACCLAIETGVVPPTKNLEHPDPDCDLDYVSGGAREVPVHVAMNNAYAFGGNNASVLFSKVRA